MKEEDFYQAFVNGDFKTLENFYMDANQLLLETLGDNFLPEELQDKIKDFLNIEKE